MVDKASSSSSLFLWSKSAWVEARTTCDHLASLSSDLTHFPTLDTPCNRCHHPDDNWLCLCCKDVLCSRYVNKHMLYHFQQSKHCMALGYNDLSVWCHLCNAYLDAQVILPLRPVYETVYRLKFGEAREAPPSQAIEYLQIEDKKAEVSTSGRIEWNASVNVLKHIQTNPFSVQIYTKLFGAFLLYVTKNFSSIFSKKKKPMKSREVKRSLRDVKPSHYIFKIESFSTLLETKTEKYETDDFEAGGYKWKLCLYPNGNKKRNGEGYISLYLEIVDTEDLPCGWEVNVNFKLFVFDNIHNKYLTIEDVEQLRCFHWMKSELGFEKFLSLEEFQNPSNGYLIDDSCAFGVEVFVVKFAGKGESLSVTNLRSDKVYTWQIDYFSACKEHLYSKEFNIGGRNWKLLLYPNGYGTAKSQSLSVYLVLADTGNLSLKPKLYAKYKLRIRDQVCGEHREREFDFWFSATSTINGYNSFMCLSDINDKSKGFIVNDTLFVEAEIEKLYVTKRFI